MENTALATTGQLEDIARSGAQILEANVNRAEKAVTVGKTILQLIKENGMTPELDERANKFLVNCRTAKNEMEVQRKPITTFFDTIRKQYTEAEGKLDVAKADSIPAALQTERNTYVKAIREAEEKRRAEQQRKLDCDNEAIEIKASIERQFSEYFQAHTLTRKQNMQNSFNTITLAEFDSKANALKALIPSYKHEHFHAFSPTVSARYCAAEQVAEIRTAFMQGQDVTLLAAVVESELLKFKNELVDKLPSLKTSLEEMAKAGEEEQKRLAQAKVDREKKEQEDLQQKAAAEAKAAQEVIDLKKLSEQTEAMMENTSVSEDGNAPESRSGFTINILHPAGVLEIVNFWFLKEGAQLSVPDLEKKTVKQMKTFCENYAHKNEERITSKYLTYEPCYKAVNRKQ